MGLTVVTAIEREREAMTEPTDPTLRRPLLCYIYSYLVYNDTIIYYYYLSNLISLSCANMQIFQV